MSEEEQLEAGIASLETQRALLGSAVVDLALDAMRERLAALRAQAQTLKQVSVLFLDVVGSTALAGELDPEEVHQVMDGALARCADIVRNHGGRVLQFAGDNLLAAFGTDRSQEDDAERAVRCGLALLAEGRALGEQVVRDYGHAGCDVRVGVHTGPVLLGGGVDAEGTIRGATVNLAARMEQTAPAGGLRISQDTWMLVRGTFDAQPQPLLTVKGHDDPVASWLVQRARPRAFHLPQRGIDGLRAPLVGRQDELAQMRAVVEAARTTGAVHGLTLIADPGLGKSRLLQELRVALASGSHAGRLLLGRAHPQSLMQPYGLLRDLLSSLLQISDSDDGELAKAKLTAGLTPLFAARGEAQAHLIGQLIGLPFGSSPHLRGVDPRQLRDLAFVALREALRGLAGREGPPLVVLLEDLQWADDGSLDFLAQIGTGTGLPLALLMTARPGLLERRVRWGAGDETHARLILSPLSDGQSQTLATALLARVNSGAERLHALLIEQAEGNPFYMEELLKMLLDQGVIHVDHGADQETWQLLPERLQSARLPATLVGVLQARLDALSAADRSALQHASIVGHVFWDDALATLDPEAPAAVPALRRKDLVKRHGQSAFEGTAEEAFHHHLLHQVTYDSVLRSAKRLGHARAARWLAQRVGDRTTEYLAITAEHFFRAGEPARAIDFFEQAALDASRRFANSAAIVYADRALRMPELDDLRRRDALLRIQEEAADFTGEPKRAEEAVNGRAAIAESLDDDRLRAAVLSGRARLCSRRGDEVAGLELAQQAVAVAERCNAAAVAAIARGQIAHCLYMRGDMAAVRPHVEAGLVWIAQALQEEDNAANRFDKLQLLNYLTIAELGDGRLGPALAAARRALQQAQAYGVRRMQAAMLNTMAGVELALARHGDALPRLEQAADLAHELNWPLLESFAQHNAGVALRMAGQPQAALEINDVAAATAARIQIGQHHGRCLLLRGVIHADLGDMAGALVAYQEALTIFEGLADAPYCCQVQARIAMAQLAQGWLTLAVQGAEKVAAALADGVSLGGTEEPLFAPLVCACVWAAAGDARALPQIEAAHAELQAQLARVEDAGDRQRMLELVPPNRAIVDTLAALRSG